MVFDNMPLTYSASVETDAGTYQHGYHLGTIETIARACVWDISKMRPKNGTHIKTVALIFDGRIIDVFDGKEWMSEILARNVESE